MFFKPDWTGCAAVPSNGPCVLAKSLAWAMRHQLPLQEAVLTLLPDGKAPQLYNVELRGGSRNWDACLRKLYLDLYAGGSLADALDKNLRYFLPAYFIAAVRGAEREGRLAEVLPDFAERLNYSTRLGRLFRQRLFFPCAELLVILCILTGGLEIIAPKLIKIFTELSEGDFIFVQRAHVLLGGLSWVAQAVFPALGLFWLFRRLSLRFGALAELLPFLRGHCHKLALLDFYGCVASYLAVGSDIAAAADNARSSCPSRWLRRRLASFVAAARAGEPLAETLDLLPCSSDLERWLLHEAAANGHLGEGFDNAQRLLAQKLFSSTKGYALAAELLLLFFNAALVAAVAVGMFAAMRTIIYHVGGG